MPTFLRLSHNHLRRLLHRHISSSPLHPTTSPHSLQPVFRHALKPYYPFSSLPQPYHENDQIALSLSSQLLSQPQPEPESGKPNSLSLSQRLDLSFSHITLTPELILQTLNNSGGAGRVSLDFLKWVSSKSDFELTDEVLSYFIDYFGRRKDFKILHDVLVEGKAKNLIGIRAFKSVIDRLIRSGRATHAISFFEKMGEEYNIVRDREKFNFIVENLCEHGYGNHAEKLVKSLANEFFPDQFICDTLIKGWCVDGKLEEAKRLAREMYRGGFELGTSAYNAILDCVCKLCRMKDLFRLVTEAENLLIDMDRAGVPRNTETFNVLIENLCKIRKTEDGLKLFSRMGEWGCAPDSKTYIVLIRSLYLAARVGEGDEMIEKMKTAGFGDALGIKEYYGFLRTLCGIERVDHALKLFRKMKRDRRTPGALTYELLIRKLYEHGRGEKANEMFNEAVRRGVEIERKEYKVDPRFEPKPKVVKKKGKTRLTLPEKTALKKKKLRKLRMSFVRKPKKNMRRA